MSLLLLSTTSQGTYHQNPEEMFSQFGVPETVVSDNGPQYSSKEFAEFSKSYNFCHISSSPHFPQSNGQAECTVQSVKDLLKESEDPSMALLAYRSTPFPWCNLSPGELLMGRRIRANVSQIKEHLVSEWKFLEEFQWRNKDFKGNQKRDYDRRHLTLPLSPIPDDTDVRIPNLCLDESYYLPTPLDLT